MAKKKGGKSSGNVSAGIHSNVSRQTKNAVRKEYMASADRVINQRKAFDQGKNVMVTIPNTDSARGGPFIRVNAREVWKYPMVGGAKKR